MLRCIPESIFLEDVDLAALTMVPADIGLNWSGDGVIRCMVVMQ